jgi:hypothetical protein
MEGKMLNSLAILLLAMGLLACGEGKKDELGPYVQTIQGFETHTKKLSTYRNYLTTPGMESKADAVKETYQVLIDELKKIELEDKKMRSAHNALVRGLTESLRKIGEPSSPTFVVTAARSIKFASSTIQKFYDTLELLWKDSERAEPFPLKWEPVD